MRILVCVKRVPAPGARINLTADGQAVDTAYLGFTTSPHEECAVEAAVQLVEAARRRGDRADARARRGRGAAALRRQRRHGRAPCCSPIDGADWDPQRTARAITSAVAELEATDGPFDLILFGNESADSGGFQVGIRVAHALGRPMVNGAKGIDVDGRRAPRVRRESDAGVEVVRAAAARGRSASRRASTCPATRR